MKKIVLLSVVLFLLPAVSKGEKNPIKLRTSFNPGYLRIVLEGADEIIAKTIVNQKGQNIVVTFPGPDFQIQTEKGTVVYKKINNSVTFSPGDFRGLKVFSLQNPGRLVLDVFQGEKKGEKNKDGLNNSPAGAGLKPAPAAKTKTLVIDPGHGGFERGIVRGDNAEKSVVLDIAGRLRALAEKGAFESSLTRNGDLFMTRSERIKYANGSAADIFISLHVGNHKDIVIYIPVITETVPDAARPYLYNKGQDEYLKKTVDLLNAEKDALTEEFGSDMVTVRPLPYSILSHVEAAALMIELPSFDTYYSEDFKTKTASALYKGLYLYEESYTK
ncbi:MAG: N-acetylmuramoyl-L-alanine amidase [Nitrospirae bacterium]|nr:N-acetylmuramoyl-L-alanine amidase [Nitrospirota bacterium]